MGCIHDDDCVTLELAITVNWQPEQSVPANFGFGQGVYTPVIPVTMRVASLTWTRTVHVQEVDGGEGEVVVEAE